MSMIINGDTGLVFPDSSAQAKAPFGKQTIWIPAGAMTPRTTNGTQFVTAESITNKVMLQSMNFDAATIEYSQFNVRMPKSWNVGSVSAYFVWSVSGATSGDCVWAIQAQSYMSGDVFDGAFGTAVSVTGTVTATGTVYQTVETSALTIGGTPSDNDWLVFQVYRDASNVADTLSIDARLHGVVVVYTTDSIDDA